MKDVGAVFHPQQNSFVGKNTVAVWRKSSTSCIAIVFEYTAHDKDKGRESIVMMNKSWSIILITIETDKKEDSRDGH
jgi:hypothetical protein